MNSRLDLKLRMQQVTACAGLWPPTEQVCLQHVACKMCILQSKLEILGPRSRRGQPQNASSCSWTSRGAHPMQLLQSGRRLSRLQWMQKRWQMPG